MAPRGLHWSVAAWGWSKNIRFLSDSILLMWYLCWFICVDCPQKNNTEGQIHSFLRRFSYQAIPGWDAGTLAPWDLPNLRGQTSSALWRSLDPNPPSPEHWPLDLARMTCANKCLYDPWQSRCTSEKSIHVRCHPKKGSYIIYTIIYYHLLLYIIIYYNILLYITIIYYYILLLLLLLYIIIYYYILLYIIVYYYILL